MANDFEVKVPIFETGSWTWSNGVTEEVTVERVAQLFESVTGVGAPIPVTNGHDTREAAIAWLEGDRFSLSPDGTQLLLAMDRGEFGGYPSAAIDTSPGAPWVLLSIGIVPDPMFANHVPAEERARRLYDAGVSLPGETPRRDPTWAKRARGIEGGDQAWLVVAFTSVTTVRDPVTGDFVDARSDRHGVLSPRVLVVAVTGDSAWVHLGMWNVSQSWEMKPILSKVPLAMLFLDQRDAKVRADELNRGEGAAESLEDGSLGPGFKVE